jgi:hypothetical protein
MFCKTSASWVRAWDASEAVGSPPGTPLVVGAETACDEPPDVDDADAKVEALRLAVPSDEVPLSIDWVSAKSVAKMLEIDSPPPPPPPPPEAPWTPVDDEPDDVAPDDVAAAVDPEPPPTADCKPLSKSDRVDVAVIAAAPAARPAPPPWALSSDAKVLLANCEDELSLATGGGADVAPSALPAAPPSKSCSRLEAS